ncbi:hypothetical protein EGJ05_10185 [Stutzerimonas xanthomarina]|nr:hypothetical protein EGJ05_10185 [Stutzerimonas xanthomarina]
MKRKQSIESVRWDLALRYRLIETGPGTSLPCAYIAGSTELLIRMNQSRRYSGSSKGLATAHPTQQRR